MGNIRSVFLTCIAVVTLSLSCFAGFLPNTVNCTLGVTPQSGNPPLPVTASGSCSEFDANGAPVPLTITIDFGDGTAPVTGATAQHTYTRGGATYTVIITGTDAQQRTGNATQPVTVNNVPPVCTLNVTPTSGSAPLTVTANGNCTDPDDNLSITQIDWGDGQVDGDTDRGTHTFTSPGVYTVILTGFDRFEAQGSASVPVTVANAPALFLGAGSGKVIGIQSDGSISQTLDTTLGGTITGMLFDFNGNLFVTNFTAGNVSVFPNSDSSAAVRTSQVFSSSSVTFGSGYDCQPESIAEDGNGNVFVGLAGCKKNVLKFDPSGKQLASYAVTIEDQGADWIDLAADDCTLFYTSEGNKVMRYNVCGNRQLPDFAGGFHKALAIKLLPDGGVIVADNVDIHRTDITGKIIKTYDTDGNDCWVALTLDPSGTSFYATNSCNSQVVQFDLDSGNVLQTIKVNSATNSLFGIVSAGFTNNFLFVGASPQSNTTNNSSATYSISVGFGCSAGQCSSVRPLQTTTAPQTVALYCSNLPIGAKCSFSPAAVAINGSSSTLTITTSNTTIGSLHSQSPIPMPIRPSFLAILGSLSISFGVLAVPRRRAYRKWLGTAFLVCTLLFLIACGTHALQQTLTTGPIGAPQTGTTPPGTYTINVNAGNGQFVNTSTISLTVK